MRGALAQLVSRLNAEPSNMQQRKGTPTGLAELRLAGVAVRESVAAHLAGERLRQGVASSGSLPRGVRAEMWIPSMLALGLLWLFSQYCVAIACLDPDNHWARPVSFATRVGLQCCPPLPSISPAADLPGISTVPALATQLALCTLLAALCRSHLRALDAFHAPAFTQREAAPTTIQLLAPEPPPAIFEQALPVPFDASPLRTLSIISSQPQVEATKLDVPLDAPADIGASPLAWICQIFAALSKQDEAQPELGTALPEEVHSEVGSKAASGSAPRPACS